MGFLKKIFRVSEWFTSKLPLHIAIFLLFAYIAGYDAQDIVWNFFLFIAYAITYLGLNYLANDLSDVEDDRKVGKRNAFQNTSIKIGVAAFIITSFIHFLIVLLINISWQFIVFAIIGYLFGIFYSFRPIRFKERGVLGLIVASFFQRNLQLFVIPFIFDVNWVLFSIINVASFVYGLRFILIHQYIDYENDKASGTKTFVGRAKKITKAIIYSCLVIEMILIFVSFASVLYQVSKICFIILVIGYALEVLMWVLMRKNKQTDIFTSYFYVPMNFIYLLALPLVSCIIILLVNISVWYWVVLFVASLVLAFFTTIKFHYEYISYSIERANVISSCIKNEKKTIRLAGVRFLNIKPYFNGDVSDLKVKDYVIVSPIKIRIDIKEIIPFLSENECVEVRYSASQSIKEHFEKETRAFQLQNEQLRKIFSIYIFKKADFDRYQRKTMSETIIQASASCKEVKIYFIEFNSLEILDNKLLEKEFATFAGLSCAELYQRKKDCFKRIFPVSFCFNLLFLVLGSVGYIFFEKLFIFSFFALGLNLMSNIVIGLIFLFNKKVKVGSLFRFYVSLYNSKINKVKVPGSMVYGIDTTEIVKKASYERLKVGFLIFSILVSFIITTLI